MLSFSSISYQHRRVLKTLYSLLSRVPDLGAEGTLKNAQHIYRIPFSSEELLISGRESTVGKRMWKTSMTMKWSEMKEFLQQQLLLSKKKERHDVDNEIKGFQLSHTFPENITLKGANKIRLKFPKCLGMSKTSE